VIPEQEDKMTDPTETYETERVSDGKEAVTRRAPSPRIVRTRGELKAELRSWQRHLRSGGIATIVIADEGRVRGEALMGQAVLEPRWRHLAPHARRGAERRGGRVTSASARRAILGGVLPDLSRRVAHAFTGNTVSPDERAVIVAAVERVDTFEQLPADVQARIVALEASRGES
jgi:hypothetical protein